MFIEFFNQNILLFIVLIVVFNLLILSILSARVKGAKTISALEMPQLQRNENCVVIDVNLSKDFATSHIPSSINFPLEEISDQNNALLNHKNKTTVLVCQTGTRSAKVTGGLFNWSKENLPTTST